MLANKKRASQVLDSVLFEWHYLDLHQNPAFRVELHQIKRRISYTKCNYENNLEKL